MGRKEAVEQEPRVAWWQARATLASVAVAAIASLVTLLFTLFPEWRPDPRERAEATIRALALDQNVSQDAFFRRVGPLPKACAAEQLKRMGNVAYIEADVAGFKGGEVGLRWFTYDARNRRRVQGLRSNNRETSVFKPRAPVNRQIAQVWVPAPLRGGQYFVRFELYTDGILRAFVDTRKFSVVPPLPDEYRGSWCKPLRSRGF